MVEFVNVKGSNPDYYIQVSCPGHNFDVITEMPEQLTSGVQSDWESRLPYRLADLFSQIPIVGDLADKAAAATGYSPELQELSFQTWMGTSPIEIPLQLHFDHYESPYRDVYQPIMLLKSAAFPINDGLLLQPPGPVRAGSGGYGVNVKLGRMILFQNCIIVSANETLETRLGEDGYPISGDLELTLRTSMVYGHRDFLNAMQLRGT